MPEPAPIVFFLRVPQEIKDVESTVDNPPTYSELLENVEGSTLLERFSKETMMTILEKTKSLTYSSGTACFHCCHTFNWTACHLPISYDTYDKMFTVEGHYCSPECALIDLYNMPRLSDSTRWNRHALLEDLYRPLLRGAEIVPAPPRAMLRMFGGPLDIAQYREYLTTADSQVRIDLPPIRLHYPTMNIQAPTRDVKKFVQLSHDVVEKASNELRLKRSKPVHGNVPTLDKLMKA